MAIAVALVVILVAATATQAAKGGKKPPKGPTATPEPTATPCPTCPTLHASSLNVNAYEQPGYTQAVCDVEVSDQDGTLIEGALVEVQWSGAYNGAGSGYTAYSHGGQGLSALIYTPEIGGKCKRNDPKCYTCLLTNISKPGYVYDPLSNTQNSDQDSCDIYGTGCPN
jgi:hypothetical protein